MNDKGQAAGPPLSRRDDVPERLSVYDGYTDTGDYTDTDAPVAEVTAGLTNFGFIREALRHGVRLWGSIAVAGLLAGLAIVVARPSPYQAATSVLLPPPPYQNAIDDDAAVAQSRAVAGLAVRNLGLRQTAASFASDYTVAATTGRLLVITANATSEAAAVREANAVAAAFLTFQAHLLNSQQQLTNTELQQQITGAEQHVNSISHQIRQLSAQAQSPTTRAELTNLRAERTQAESELVDLKQTVYSSKASTQSAIASQLKHSIVLDKAVPIVHSRKKRLVLYTGAGLLGGLMLGLGIAVIRGFISDRLRRRDDVARIIGAPVRLSVGKVALTRSLGGQRGLAAAQSPAARRVVAHLDTAVAPDSRGLASLAVVPVDDVRVPAVCLASLALTCAQRGMQVVVADLCSGAPAARLLDATEPGVRTVSTGHTHLVVAVPEDDDVMPVGPLQRTSRRAPAANDPLARACASADLLLTLVALDPSLGSEHLASWADAAVAMVTAGKSSAVRVNAVGEMIRLSGIPLISAVLLGADKTDESLGVTQTPGAGHHGEAVGERPLPHADSLFATVTTDPGEKPYDD